MSNGLEKYPKLRFPGFEEPWTETAFSSFSAINPKSENLPDKFIYIDLESVLSGELQSEKIEFAQTAPSRAQRTLIKNDVLFQTVRPYQQNNYFYTNTNINNLPCVASTGYAVFRTKNNAKFLYALIHTNSFLADILKRCTGSNYPSINGYDIENITIFYPSLQEQEKIGDFMSLIDKKIRKTKLLIKALKKYKRGVVKGILTHQVSFVDATGNGYPEWKTCTLQDAVEFLDVQRIPLESADRANRQGKYPYYGASGIIDYVDDYIFDEPLLLLGEDGANILNRSTPLCFIATGKYWVNNHAHVMRPKNGNDIKFLCELLESFDYTRYNTGTAQPKLNQEKCRSIELCLPVYEEQHHIATFLYSLDEKAYQERCKLDCMFEFKKGLLQQLFI